MTGELKSMSSNSFRMIQGEYGAFFRNDGRNLYLLVTNAGDQNGTYNSLRPLSVNLSTGQCDISGKAVMDGDGNVISATYATRTEPTFIGGIEISGDTPYIDFHFSGDQGDYTSRIRETSKGTVTLYGNLVVSGSVSANGGGVTAYPNYAAGVDITSTYNSAPYQFTFSKDGWLFIRALRNNTIYISNGYVVAASSTSEDCILIPVRAGDVIRGGQDGDGKADIAMFYPNR